MSRHRRGVGRLPDERAVGEGRAPEPTAGWGGDDVDMPSFVAGFLAGVVGLGAIMTGLVLLLASRLPKDGTENRS